MRFSDKVGKDQVSLGESMTTWLESKYWEGMVSGPAKAAAGR